MMQTFTFWLAIVGMIINAVGIGHGNAFAFVGFLCSFAALCIVLFA